MENSNWNYIILSSWHMKKNKNTQKRKGETAGIPKNAIAASGKEIKVQKS